MEELSATKSIIIDSICNKFACHVWQRIFEIGWTKADIEILFTKVSIALKGKWVEVSKDENGSLVVQCLFENIPYEVIDCSEEITKETFSISKGFCINQRTMGKLGNSAYYRTRYK